LTSTPHTSAGVFPFNAKSILKALMDLLTLKEMIIKSVT